MSLLPGATRSAALHACPWLSYFAPLALHSDFCAKAYQTQEMMWGEAARRRLAQRALERQLAYQQHKAQHVQGREEEIIAAMIRSSMRVREKLEKFQPIKADARVVEIGSGAHGLIFYFGTEHRIGVDPLAVSYVSLFPGWQCRAQTIAAIGESLPFADQSFDVVLCDNVVDHAESPRKIVGELARILVRGGLLYFTVNIHHQFTQLRPVCTRAGELRVCRTRSALSQITPRI